MGLSFFDLAADKSKKKGPISLLLYFTLFLFIIPLPSVSQEAVLANPNELILITRLPKENPETISIGSKEFSDRKYSPASTFKSYLALSLLENRVVGPAEKILCSDKHIPNIPRKLDLREALFYSSNMYFEIAFPRLGKEKLTSTLKRIGYLSPEKSKTEDWWTDIEGLKHGGSIRKSPEEIHSYWVKLFENGYGISDELNLAWKQSLYWSDCGRKKAKVYGKTGSWEGSFWFQGSLFFPQQNSYVIYTILHRDKNSSRTETIRRFYELVGCEMPSLD